MYRDSPVYKIDATPRFNNVFAYLTQKKNAYIYIYIYVTALLITLLVSITITNKLRYLCSRDSS